jgi:hypothetical protein
MTAQNVSDGLIRQVAYDDSAWAARDLQRKQRFEQKIKREARPVYEPFSEALTDHRAEWGFRAQVVNYADDSAPIWRWVQRYGQC